MRAIFFEQEHAEAAAARLRAQGYEAYVTRERFAGEDDDEDHPWAVLSDAPEIALELLVDELDGWLDAGELDLEQPRPAAPPLDLPTSPRRHHRAPSD